MKRKVTIFQELPQFVMTWATFTSLFVKKRGIKGDENDIILGADDGKGILKVTMTMTLFL